MSAHPALPLLRPKLRAPAPDAHKYSRGMAVIVGGEMPGAALLAAEAAMRLCGYVALVDGASGGPHALVRRQWDEVVDDPRVTAMLIGCGLGQGAARETRLDAALATSYPLVLDGDALTILGARGTSDFSGRRAPVILTPHAGEFDALFGASTDDKLSRTIWAAHASAATVIFKGQHTVIADPDERVVTSHGAPSWLASAGTGDVLAGMLTGLLATGLAPFEAACAAVWLHGECARLAGPALIADDLPLLIGRAVAACL
jgi:hydroxyethylthiazole kinase-like uncharacterized protein yjeF